MMVVANRNPCWAMAQELVGLLVQLQHPIPTYDRVAFRRHGEYDRLGPWKTDPENRIHTNLRIPEFRDPRKVFRHPKRNYDKKKSA